MAADAEYYLGKADEMREIAELVRDPTLKVQYAELAAQYESLAQLVSNLRNGAGRGSWGPR